MKVAIKAFIRFYYCSHIWIFYSRRFMSSRYLLWPSALDCEGGGRISDMSDSIMGVHTDLYHFPQCYHV